MVLKVDSNATGLRFAEESAVIRVLSGAPVWYPLEPNSYKDFGGQIKTIARNPINASRQRKKGVTTDLDASGGFVQDLTTNNTHRLLQGFFFADAREKKTTAPLAVAGIPLTSVSATQYLAASGMGTFKPGDIVFASGFTNANNNGVKNVSAAAAGSITTVEANTVEAAPPAAAQVEVVGFKFAVTTMSIVLNGTLARLTQAGGTDLTTLGLIVGEWIHIGGDGAGAAFVNNRGFARISVITAAYIEFDKSEWAPAAEAATGITLQVFFGMVIKNEQNPALIKRRTYNIERTLGNDDNGVMSEYLVGAVPNELTLNIPMADKATIDMSFVSLDNEQRTGLTGVKTGTRPTLVPAPAFNTSSDVARIKMSLVSTASSNPLPLFAYATEVSLTINNNVSPNKAIGVLGGFETSAGTFEVGGKLTCYFADVTAVQSVRNNSDITMDIILCKQNKGMLWDIPLLALGDGRLSVEQDQSIMIPLDKMAAESALGHTLTFQLFAYLPTVAM